MADRAEINAKSVSDGNTPHEGVGTWLFENVVAPAWDAGVAEPLSIVHFDKAKIDYTPAKMTDKPAEWVAQSIGSVAGIVPYVLAGRAVGGASRLLAESTGAEATIFGKFAASESLTQIAGAGVYDFAKPVKDGGGVRERTANALSGMVSFSLFEGGNHLINPAQSLLSSTIARAGVGAIGGASSYLTHEAISQDHSFDAGTFFQHAATGGLMNSLLPATQGLFRDKVATPIDNVTGRGIPVGRYVIDRGWESNSQLLGLAKGASTRLTRVLEQPTSQLTDGRASVKDIRLGQIRFTRVTLDKDVMDTDKQGQLGHELQHKANQSELEPKYKEAAKLIGIDPEKAREEYIKVRRTDENRALQTETLAGAEAAGFGSSSEAPALAAEAMLRNTHFEEFHTDLFDKEANEFVASGGTFRPTESFAHSGGAGGGRGGRGDADRQGDGTRKDVFVQVPGTNAKYNELREEWEFNNAQEDVPEQKKSYLTNEVFDDILKHQAKMGKNPQTGKTEYVSERLIRKGAGRDPRTNEWWGSVELNRYGIEHPTYGFIYDRLDKAFDGASLKFYVKESGSSNFAPGTILATYPAYETSKGEIFAGTDDPVHGHVDAIEHQPDGTKAYWRGGERIGWDYKEPKLVEGVEDLGPLSRSNRRLDGTTAYFLPDGRYYEAIPSRLILHRLRLREDEDIPENEQANWTDPADDKHYPSTFLVDKVVPQGNGSIDYHLTDQRVFRVITKGSDQRIFQMQGNQEVPVKSLSGPAQHKYPAQLVIARAPGVRLPEDELPNGGYLAKDGSRNPIYQINSIFHEADGTRRYDIVDGPLFEVKLNDGRIEVSKYSDGKFVPLEGVAGYVAEEYPQFPGLPGGRYIKVGDGSEFSEGLELHEADSQNQLPSYTRSFTRTGFTDLYDQPLVRYFGIDATPRSITMSRHFRDLIQDLAYDKDGNYQGAYSRYLVERQSMNEPAVAINRTTPRGLARGVFIDAQDNPTYDLVGQPTPQPGQTILENHILGLDVSTPNGPLVASDGRPALEGVIKHVVRSTDSFWYLTDQNEAIEVPLGPGRNVIKHILNPSDEQPQTIDDLRQRVVSDEFLPTSKIVETYRQGRESHLGGLSDPSFASRMIVSSDGSIASDLVNDPIVSDATEFLVPRLVKVGNNTYSVTYGQHLKNGTYRVLSTNEEPLLLTPADYRGLLG